MYVYMYFLTFHTLIHKFTKKTCVTNVMIFRGPDPETPLSVSKAMGLAQKIHVPLGDLAIKCDQINDLVMKSQVMYHFILRTATQKTFSLIQMFQRISNPFKLQAPLMVLWMKMGVSKNRGTPKWMVYNRKLYQNG